MFTRLPDEFLGSIPGTGAEHRQRVQQAAQERAAQRDSELEAQASLMRDPQERISIWERLHALSLPRAPNHALVKVIARQTRLTVGQVHQEQQRRAAFRSAPRVSATEHAAPEQQTRTEPSEGAAAPHDDLPSP